MRQRLASGFGALSFALGLQGAATAAANDVHRIETLPDGFAFYRSGKPAGDDVAEYCRLGITEIAALAGNADQCELRFRGLSRPL